MTDRDLPSGAEFSRRFFTEVVEPLLSQAVPRALLAGITDPEVAWLPPMIGSIEQWVDCVDVVSNPGRRAALRTAYRAWIDAGCAPSNTTRPGGRLRRARPLASRS